MGIYLSNIEMPKDRGMYIAIDIDGQVYAKPLGAIEWKRLDQKAVPVPPHGRLIDADALMLKILDYIEEYSDVDEKGWHNLKWCAMKEAEMAINDAPTIIPAEEDKT